MPTVAELGQRVLSGNTDLFSRITGIFSTTLSFFSYTIIVFFVSLFLAAQPAVYRDSFLRLIPKDRRARIRETLSLVAHTLQLWLLTRFISVVVIGVLTTGGLLLMNIPLALSLGIVAAVAGFIPTFGPILALIPALLVAFTTTPAQFVGVLLLYLGIQLVDNYLITPAIQKEMLQLPPAYVIVMQLLFGIIAGPFGLILAAPLATALVIIVRLLYVEDVLGDRTDKQAQ
jgi:predicted PurR-regulated permease PerM